MDIFNETGLTKKIECDSMINGVCENTTLDGCINMCNDSDSCAWGQFIQPNICMPVKQDYYPKLNPWYILKKDEPTSTVFMKKYEYQKPPIRQNIIFLYDTIQIQHVDTNTLFIPSVKFITSGFFSPYPQGLLNFIPLTKDTPIMIFDYLKDRILRPEATELEWIRSVETINSGYNAFNIIPYNRDFTLAELFYSDTFQIKTGLGGYLTLSSENVTEQKQNYLDDLNIINKSDSSTLFRFIKQ